MSSLTRSFGALRRAAGSRSALASIRYNSTSTPSNTPATDAAAASSSASSGSASDASSSSSSSSSSTPSERTIDPLRPTHTHISANTPFGPTSAAPKPSDTASESIPLSHRILPLTPSPIAPWQAEKTPTIYHVNYPRPAFPTPKPADRPEVLGGDMTQRREKVLSALTGLSPLELRNLRRCNVEMRWVVNMTKKGKIRSSMAYVVVGDPKKGLVGLGRGRGPTHSIAVENAFFQACLEMAPVNRYEDRTLWGQGEELKSKFGATRVALRARPPGHGLRVPYSVHRVMTACGIRDASAQIDGSKEPVQVMKAVIQLLHGGANPPGFGNGLGDRGKRQNKGAGMRSKDEIERVRGRYGVDVGLRV